MNKLRKLLTFGLALITLLSAVTSPAVAAEARVCDDCTEIETCDDDCVECEESQKAVEIVSRYSTVEDVLGNASADSCCYMYNIDGSPDFIYMELQGGGYAIFLRSTMEMLEFSASGSIDFGTEKAVKYYFGPGYYLTKSGSTFNNVVTGEKYTPTKDEISQKSTELRDMLTAASEEKGISSNGYSVDSAKQLIERNACQQPSESKWYYDPSLQHIDFNKDATYITNFSYFASNPEHGNNGDGRCIAIAAQLLLSYHNYYNDRRIIPDNYLGVNNECNCNTCIDPMDSNRNILGTTKEYSDILFTSYFPATTNINMIRDSFCSLLNSRGINYSIDYGFSNNGIPQSAIMSLIGNDNPALVLMSTALGSDYNHAAVAYGYYNFSYGGKAFYGYITHIGYASSDMAAIWVNEAWICGYVALTVNHTHSYSRVGEYGICGNQEYKCSVCGHRTGYYIEGKTSDRYVERIVNLDAKTHNYVEYTLNFNRAGNRTIQTFGTSDAYLELYDSNHNKLRSNDDSGFITNALFTYNFNAGTKYFLRIRTYSYSTARVKFGIVASSSYSSYESIYSLTNYTMGLTSSFTRYKVNLYTYKFTSQKDMLMYLSSDSADSFLYIIDPTSVQLCLNTDGPTPEVTRHYACSYNDDCNKYDLDAGIRKIFKANIPYLIIAATYNPGSSHNSSGSFYLNFPTIYT